MGRLVAQPASTATKTNPRDHAAAILARPAREPAVAMALLASFITRYPLQSAFLVSALLLAGLADGLSLSALLPLLQLAFDTPGDDSELAQFVRDTMAQFELSPSIGTLLIVMLIGVFIKNTLVFVSTQRIGYIAADVATELRMNLLRAVTATRWQYYVSQSTGELANAMATEALRASNAYVYAVRLFAVLVETLVYAVVAVLVSWQATLICFAASLVIVSVSQILVRISHRAGIQQTEWYRTLLGRLTDVLQSVKPFKAMGRDHIAEDALADDTHQLRRALKQEVLGNSALEAGQEPMYTSVVAAGMFVALVLFDLDLATVTFMVLILARLLKRIGKVQKIYQRMMVCESAYFAIEASTNRALLQAEVTDGCAPPVLERSIEFQGVSFAYGENVILDRVDFAIEAGTFTTMVGDSGAGKTTVADLIIGLIRPDAGRISIDGVDLETIDLRAWRRQIGYVPQENLLLHRSVLANVTLGDECLSDADAEQALRDSGAWTFVRQMPDGIHTIVGERGTRLSGGQRQRVMIARALAHHPRLLILDEATSALDQRTEQDICATLRSLAGPLTVVAVTHQRALADAADQVLRLTNCKVRPAGLRLQAT